MRRLSREDLMDILNGAAILGAGGGGGLEEGIGLIDHALSEGKTFDLAQVDEVPDDALICTPYMLGAISELSPGEEAAYAGLSRPSTHPILAAYDRFQAHLGQSFYGTTACELGGSNTAAAFYPAAMNGHMIIDADPAGRAVPEITHSTYFLAGLPAAPIFAANEFGETFVLDGVQDDQRAETLVRALSAASRNDIAAIDHALPMGVLRGVLIEGTISKSLELGRRARIAGAQGEDVAQVVAGAGGGVTVFAGEVTQAAYEAQNGFTIGRIEIAGEAEYAGQSLTVSVKNENMAALVDGAVLATVPDLICLFDRALACQISNPDVRKGQSVSVVVLPAPEAFLTEKGLSIFGPAYAGIDQPYRPPAGMPPRASKAL